MEISRGQKLVELSKKLNEVVIHAASADEKLRELSRLVEELNLKSNKGWINHAGRVADGTFQVEFDIHSDGYSSRWPQWAYEVALQAVIHNKKVWVISDGIPYGQNLLQVIMLAESA
ncbi:MAG TPA: hypothetical protein VI389_10990 [Geobacteraceae bacterium]